MARTPPRRAKLVADDATIDLMMAHLADLVTTERMLRALNRGPLESVALVTMAVLYMQASDPAQVMRTVKAQLRQREVRVARLTAKTKKPARKKARGR